jgi:hypothetical protein
MTRPTLTFPLPTSAAPTFHAGTLFAVFMRDIGERRVPDFHPRNFCDPIEHAPFAG